MGDRRIFDGSPGHHVPRSAIINDPCSVCRPADLAAARGCSVATTLCRSFRRTGAVELTLDGCVRQAPADWDDHTVGRRILMRFSMRARYGDRVVGSHPAPLPQRGTGLARSGTGPFPSCFFPAHTWGYRADPTSWG
jgi:hypothetical protein